MGACLGCVVKTVKEDAHSHVKNARVCKDGPVFTSAQIAEMKDFGVQKRDECGRVVKFRK